MDREKNAKVRQLYQAVTDLIEEGMDVNSMKVIDITNRAGIGKGTAYEYFKSKEELVAAAIAADMKRHADVLGNMLAEADCFEKKVRAVFGWMDREMKRRRSMPQFFRFLCQSYEVTAGIRREFRQCSGEEMDFLENMLKDVIGQGRKEGCIRDGLSGEQTALTLVSAFVTYYLYLDREEAPDPEKQEQMQAFLYGNLIKCLR